LKNVLRYRHRTWVTVLAMAFAGAIMIFYAGLFEGWMGAMETNAVSMEMGEMQIHAQGYRDDPDLYTVIPDYHRVIRQAENSGLIASPRLLGGGLAAAHENSVQGVLKSVGQGIDRGGLIMGDRDFREFFALPEGVHEIVMKRADNGVLLEQATKKMAELVPDLEVNSWRELQPTLARLLDLSDVSMIIMLLIIYAAVGMLTMNAMLMGVFERIPVFGVMKAVGFSGCRLFGLVFSETLLLVTMASVLSLALGVPLSYYFEQHPIDFSFLLSESSTIAGIAFEPQWYCRVTAGSIVMPVVFLYIVALLSVLYPAWKAAVISPVKAIHHT
jgi:ABC-type lipoprotein release transport system permease subunit